MTTEYVLQLPDFQYVSLIDTEQWAYTTVPEILLARRFQSATQAELFAYLLVLPEGYAVEPVEQRQYLFTFHA